MDDLTFQELEAEMFRLYGAKEYVAGRALVEREAPRFPEQAWRTTYWRICLAALTGDIPVAIELMQQGVAAGHWWAEQSLRHDPDLRRLQGHPEFERLVEICRERRIAAQAGVKPELLVLPPDATLRPPFPVIFALHGAGGTAQRFSLPWQAAAAAGWLVALPQSSQLHTPEGYGWPDVDLAEREIQAHGQSQQECGNYTAQPCPLIEDLPGG